METIKRFSIPRGARVSDYTRTRTYENRVFHTSNYWDCTPTRVRVDDGTGSWSVDKAKAFDFVADNAITPLKN